LRLAKKFNYHIAFIITNTLKSIITTGKDKLEVLSCCDVIYKINYMDCNTLYVGQTKRCLKTRIQKYKSDIKKKKSNMAH